MRRAECTPWLVTAPGAMLPLVPPAQPPRMASLSLESSLAPPGCGALLQHSCPSSTPWPFCGAPSPFPAPTQGVAHQRCSVFVEPLAQGDTSSTHQGCSSFPPPAAPQPSWPIGPPFPTWCRRLGGRQQNSTGGRCSAGPHLDQSSSNRGLEPCHKVCCGLFGLKFPRLLITQGALEARSSGSNKGQMDCCVVSTNLPALWS